MACDNKWHNDIMSSKVSGLGSWTDLPLWVLECIQFHICHCCLIIEPRSSANLPCDRRNQPDTASGWGGPALWKCHGCESARGPLDHLQKPEQCKRIEREFPASSQPVPLPLHGAPGGYGLCTWGPQWFTEMRVTRASGSSSEA